MHSVQYDRFLFLCVLSSDVSDSRYFINEEDNKLKAIKGVVGRVLGTATYRKSKGKVVCILLGISPASDYGLPTFRNTLSVGKP